MVNSSFHQIESPTFSLTFERYFFPWTLTKMTFLLRRPLQCASYLETMNGNGNASELEAMKQEILREMRKEIAKAKLEIIEGEITK